MAEERFRSLLEAEVAGSGLSLDARCLDRLVGHYNLLSKWNRAVRLLGDDDPELVVKRHAMESLALVPYIHEKRGALLDIGSGNGYPAIPLKCALPGLRVLMLEPTMRKSIFLDHVIDDLGLEDTSVIRQRVDSPQDLSRLGRWDCITMRGVAAIPAVMEGAPAALRPLGRIVLMVGESGRAEILRRIVAPLALVEEKRLAHTQRSFVMVIGRTNGSGSPTVH